MIQQILSLYKEQFEKALEHLHTECSSLRTGRANPGLLQTVLVESYGSKMPLQQLASITVADSKTLLITPWDKGQLGAIEKAILAANLGFTPSNDGAMVRISLPPPTEERRKEMVKLVGQMEERARIRIRTIREDILKEIKKAESDGGIGKDDVSAGQKKLQEVVDGYNAQIKHIAADKEKEVMSI